VGKKSLRIAGDRVKGERLQYPEKLEFENWDLR